MKEEHPVSDRPEQIETRSAVGPARLAAVSLPPPAAPARPPHVLERLLAAIAHLLMLLSVPGLMVATLIWLSQRRRSPFVAMQARDAVLWQLLCNVLLVLFAGVLLVIALTSLGGAVTSSGASGESAVTRLVGSLLGLYVLLVLAALFFGASAILGAIFALFGKTFHYPLIGRKRR
jgi:uncharacterized Tic20 family protein